MIKISGIVLTYNNIHTIKQCIKSFKKFNEVLVLDSNSTDGTKEFLKNHPKVTLYSGPPIENKWIPIHNAMILECNNPYCFYLDSDEMINVNAYDEMQELWRKYPKAFPVHGRATIVHSNQIRQERFPDPQFRGGPTKTLRYYNPRNTVHELLDPKHVGHKPLLSRMNYIIIHNRNIEQEWCRKQLEWNQQKIRETSNTRSLYDEYNVKTFDELIEFMKKMPTFPISDLEKSKFILPSKKRLGEWIK